MRNLSLYFIVLLGITLLQRVIANDCVTSDPCDEFSVCQNISTSPGYKCQCYAGFIPETNTTCTDRDECNSASTVCPNGFCINLEGSFQCMCKAGYAGSHCQYLINACVSSPCKHGGTCTNSNSTDSGYICTCSGWAPPNCEYDVDECSSPTNLCNHGYCENSDGSFRCYCDEGYSGDLCNSHSNACASGPCPPYSYCDNIDADPGYKCTCYTGFIPPKCTDRDECTMGTGNVCHNGTCSNTIGSFKCLCDPGFSGPHCTENIACHSSPCLNNGTCFTSNTSRTGYTCDCPTGYALPNCTDIDECSSQLGICGHGNCTNSPGSYQCQCHNGYTGKHCAGVLSTASTVHSSSISTHGATTKTSLLSSTRTSLPSSTPTKTSLRSTKTSTELFTATRIVKNKTSPKSVSTPTSTTTTSTTSPTTASSTSSLSTTTSLTTKSYTTIPSTSKHVSPNTNKPGATLKNKDDTKKKSWVGGHWWVFIIAGGVVCLATVSVVCFVRRRRLGESSHYNQFGLSNVPGTPTSPDPVTAENPLYEALHTDQTQMPIDNNSAYLTIKGTDQNVSNI